MLNGSFVTVCCSLSACVCVYIQYVYYLSVQICVYSLVSYICVTADSAGQSPNLSTQIPTTSTASCDISCYKYTINLFFKSPFLAVLSLSSCSSFSPVWKVWSLAFIPPTCQELVWSVYQTKTVSCHLLESQIHHPKISWSLSSTGNWHMRMKTAFYSEIIQQSCRSTRTNVCELTTSWECSLNLNTIKAKKHLHKKGSEL